MEALLSLSPNIVANKLSVSERFRKLYRTLFFYFLKKDFVHIKDFKVFETKMNARLATMEANAAAALSLNTANTLTAILTHVHPGMPPVLPGLFTGPGIGAVAPTPPVTTPAVNIDDALAQAQDALQQATGPAIAPLGDGITPEAQKATIQARQDIGIV